MSRKIYSCPIVGDEYPYKPHYEFGESNICPVCGLDLEDAEAVVNKIFERFLEIAKKRGVNIKLVRVVKGEAVNTETGEKYPCWVAEYDVDGRKFYVDVIRKVTKACGKIYYDYSVSGAYEEDDVITHLPFRDSTSMSVVCQMLLPKMTGKHPLLHGE